jgi:hypothetical protein
MLRAGPHDGAAAAKTDDKAPPRAMTVATPTNGHSA